MGSIQPEEYALTAENKDLVHHLEPAIKPAHPSLPNSLKVPYFWGEGFNLEEPPTFPFHSGYAEARNLIGDGSIKTIDSLTDLALQYIASVFKDIDDSISTPHASFTEPHLSPELLEWKKEQHAAGKILPSKGFGIQRASPAVLKLFNAENWPEPLIQNGSLFGCGMANMIIGAYDARTLYANYCIDMAFYYEHGYHKVFPEFEDLIKHAAADPHAMGTPAGTGRSEAAKIGMQYIKGKVELESKLKAKLGRKVARLDRRTAQIMFFSESSLMGMTMETILRDFDPAATMSDMVFSSPGTDVVDVGSDLNNSEIMNAFLNTADISDSGIVSEEILRRVYDAYACTGARMHTKRWAEPVARMCSTLYPWHIQNNRHGFCRRALLGYGKVRKEVCVQREADFDEVFDENLRTTGFSRPLENACDGGYPCDAVGRLVNGHSVGGVLAELWTCLETAPLEYAKKGRVSREVEDEIAESLNLAMARTYSLGLVDELSWLLAHACHHAWQVNLLFEAAMFGSLLDDGGLKGKLDRGE